MSGGVPARLVADEHVGRFSVWSDDVAVSGLAVSQSADGPSVVLPAGFRVDVESHGFGLVNMRERAASMPGELVVRSVLGRGTEVELRLGRR